MEGSAVATTGGDGKVGWFDTMLNRLWPWGDDRNGSTASSSKKQTTTTTDKEDILQGLNTNDGTSSSSSSDSSTSSRQLTHERILQRAEDGWLKREREQLENLRMLQEVDEKFTNGDVVDIMVRFCF